ncbi:type IV pilin N-terminal domain-containing protein [Natrarchaeobius chitinivorans]|uniref:Type IV pilin n=1 Tax=Natrarchaeobius chitinivorans TaxID=1679083 RepID=A0A3N6LRF4_NATCH|nr:type IV pilin N-terminal domain-containing protein [Natrarchaeobius chitinivorans]RQG90967.1 type IV pilin [Natrarchaeobius chitinivorans]
MCLGWKNRRPNGNDRGVSPVIAAVLMIGITVAVVTVSATVLMGMTDTPDPAPDTGLEVRESADGDGYELVNYAGDDLDPERVRLVGNETETGWSEEALRSGERVDLEPVNDDNEIRVVWESEDGETQHLLTTLTVSGSSGGGGGGGERHIPGPTGDCNTVLQPETVNGETAVVIDEVIECDVDVSYPVYVEDGGGVIGDVGSSQSPEDVTIEDGFIDGIVNVDRNVSVTDGFITEDTTGSTASLERGEIDGDLDVSAPAAGSPNTDAVYAEDSSVEGEVSAQGNITAFDSEFEQILTSEHSEITITDVSVGDDVEANNNITITNSDVDGDVDALGDRVTLEDATVTGDVSGQSGVDAVSSTIDGSINAAYASVTLEDVTVGDYVDADGITVTNSDVGDVYGDYEDTVLEGTAIEGGIYANGEVAVLDSSTVEGEIQTDDGIDIDSSTVEGDISTDYGTIALDDGTVHGDAYFDTSLDCNGDSEINGTDCEDYDSP